MSRISNILNHISNPDLVLVPFRTQSKAASVITIGAALLLYYDAANVQKLQKTPHAAFFHHAHGGL